MRKRSQPSQQAHNDGAAIPVGIGKDDNGQDYGCGDENERYGTGGNKAAWQAACEASHFFRVVLAWGVGCHFDWRFRCHPPSSSWFLTSE